MGRDLSYSFFNNEEDAQAAMNSGSKTLGLQGDIAGFTPSRHNGYLPYECIMSKNDILDRIEGLIKDAKSNENEIGDISEAMAVLSLLLKEMGKSGAVWFGYN